MTPELDAIIELVATLEAGELERVVDAVQQRRREITKRIVVERRPYRAGSLVLETTPYPPSGKHYGPYWSFRYYADGRSRAIYLGVTDDPESVLEAKLKEREATA